VWQRSPFDDHSDRAEQKQQNGQLTISLRHLPLESTYSEKKKGGQWYHGENREGRKRTKKKLFLNRQLERSCDDFVPTPGNSRDLTVLELVNFSVPVGLWLMNFRMHFRT
jgi:hypothetical protein